MNRRQKDRRQCDTHMGERGMRCFACGRVWYSAVAALVVQRFRCVTCEGRIHTERRLSGDRRRSARAAGLPATA